MRIGRIHLENFGPFSGRVLDPVDDALTVFHGPNESGKSAVRAFIRSTLFGYLDRRNRGHAFYDYPPVNGGKASGTIDVTTTRGASYSVHREQGSKGGRVIVTGDAEGGTELLEQLLDRIGPELYQNLFSISLSELQDVATLSAPEMRDRIYSVGLGLSRVSLPDATDRLNRDLRKLRPVRSGGSIRDAEKRLAEARVELDEARKDFSRHAEVSVQLADIDDRIVKETDRLEEARALRERQKLVISLRPHWEREHALRDKIGDLPDLDDFPANPERQMDDLVRTAHMHRDEMRRGDQKQDERTDRIKNAPVVDTFEDRRDDLLKLVSETEHYRKAVEDLPEVQTGLKVEEERFTRDLDLLGSEWSEEKVAAFDTPVDLLADLQAAGRQLLETREIYREAESDVKRTTEDRQSIAEEVSRTTATRDSVEGVPDQKSEDLDARQEKLARLRGALAERFGTQGQAREAELKLADSMQESETTVISGFFGSFWFAVTVIVSSISAIAYSVWSTELAGAVPGLFGIAAGVVLLVRARTAGVGFKIKIAKPELSDARTILTEQVDQLNTRLEEISGEIKTLASEFGIGDDPSTRDVEEQAASLDRALNRRITFETRAAAVGEAGGRLAAADRRLQEISDNRTISYNNYATAYARWQEVLQQAALRNDLEPDQAHSVIERIRSLKSHLLIIHSYRGRVTSMDETIANIESRLESALEVAGLPPAEHMQAAPSLAALADKFRSHELAVQAREILISDLNGWIKQRDLLERRISQVEGQISDLLRHASTDSEEEFRKTAGLMEERWETERKLADLREINPLLVTDDGEQFRTELDRKSLDELKARFDRINDDVKTIEAGLSGLQREKGDLERQRTQLESSAKAVELRSRINLLQEKLESDASRWAVLRIAMHLLGKTRETFQRERQPALIQAASKYFEKLTLGRYPRVEAVVGEQDLVVYETDGTRKSITALSRGTAEQLYLSMRFALIEEYSRNAEPMPVIMDDILVNFDPERARAASSVIADLSSRFQVLVLTCHPQTIAYFQEACKPKGRRKERPLRLIDLDPERDAGQLTLVG